MERLSVVRDVGSSIPTKLVEGETVFVVVIPEPGTRKKSGVGVYLRFQATTSAPMHPFTRSW